MKEGGHPVHFAQLQTIWQCYRLLWFSWIAANKARAVQRSLLKSSFSVPVSTDAAVWSLINVNVVGYFVPVGQAKNVKNITQNHRCLLLNYSPGKHPIETAVLQLVWYLFKGIVHKKAKKWRCQNVCQSVLKGGENIADSKMSVVCLKKKNSSRNTFHKWLMSFCCWTNM